MAWFSMQGARELSPLEWLKIARQAIDNGMVFLLLTGGEIFLRPDFFEIYTPLTRLGVFLTLFTNGTLITAKIAARLAESPPSHTEITLYGATAATFEGIIGIPGSYASCCAGIEMLLKHQVPLALKTTITKQNLDEVEAMRTMAHRWGLPFSAGWLLSKRRDGGVSDVMDCRLSAAECVAIEASDPLNVSDWSEAALHEPIPGNGRNFYCHAGQASFVINSRGEMNVCTELPLPAVRPLDIGFRNAWEQVQQFVDQAPPLSPNCQSCSSRTYCPICPALSFMENGTLTEPVSYLCEIARARKERYQTAG